MFVLRQWFSRISETDCCPKLVSGHLGKDWSAPRLVLLLTLVARSESRLDDVWTGASLESVSDEVVIYASSLSSIFKLPSSNSLLMLVCSRSRWASQLPILYASP